MTDPFPALKSEATSPEVGPVFTVYEINEAGKTSRRGDLHGISPNGFYLASASTDDGVSRFFGDLPYFMDDLRPNGFLGRLIPPAHPDLNLPKNILDWSANDCLKYLTRYGYDLIGNLILGDDAFARYLNGQITPHVVPLEMRDQEYPRMATEVLHHGDPGSSAGGEQPKFTAVVGPDRTPVLVKFSPKIESDVSQRVADLLICEHISLEALNRNGHSAAKSNLILGDNRVFLETERFDRVKILGRRGIISLGALDNELVGKRGSWTSTAGELLKQQLISTKMFDAVCWREIFGHLIGNTDMHLANISFYFQLPDIQDLAPAYDMLPMLYAPQSGQIIDRDFNPPLPKPADAGVWQDAWVAATEFWTSVIANTLISPGFRKIAQANLEKLQSLESLKDLLPV